MDWTKLVLAVGLGALFGGWLAYCAFTGVCTGIARAAGTSYQRTKRPMQFWLTIAVQLSFSMLFFAAPLFILAARSRSLVTQAEADFQRLNPGVKIVKVYQGEGDADHAYVYVCYKYTPVAHPPRETVRELEMGYQRTGEAWTLFHEKTK
jgi:hypothetical protein